MIILLEGPDGVGKTSTADAIQQLHNGPVRRVASGPPPRGRHPMSVYSEAIVEALEASRSGELVIIDRLHVGELVYGTLLRSTAFTLDHASMIDMALTAMGAVMMHCWLPSGAAVARLAARDGFEPDPRSGSSLRHARAIHASFSALCGTPARRPVLPGPWRQLVMDEYPESLAARCLAAALVAERFGTVADAIGSASASTVVVMHDPSRELLEFVIGYLRRVGRLSDTIVWMPGTNMAIAGPSDGPLVNLSGKRIVALGRAAVDHVAQRGFDCHFVLTRDDEFMYESPSWLGAMESALCS